MFPRDVGNGRSARRGRGWFTTAELYLAVQSSRFPGDTRVVLPVNVGDFDGCRVRFVQLPFEVSPGDNLVFELLDDDGLTAEEEQRIVHGCRLAGCCVLVGGCVYAPGIGRLLAAAGDEAGDLLGEAVVAGLTADKFDSFGRAEYGVPERLPEQPNDANRLTLLDDDRYARVQLRIYGPPSPLGLSGAEAAADGLVY